MIALSPGKRNKLKLCSNEKGIIAAIAIDQRGSLREKIVKIKNSEVSDQELITFKNCVTEILTPYASAILLDTFFGLEAVSKRAEETGVLLSYDRSGYAPDLEGRIPRLLPNWSVERLIQAGADAIKLMIYYDIEDSEEINTIKHVFVERIGAECQACDVPFFLEPVCYSNAIKDKQSLDFARVKPDKVIGIMREFSKPQYRIDILKVEPPVNIRFVENASANHDGQFAYKYEDALRLFKDAGQVAEVPFIYLSAGVTTEAFHEILKMAGESGTRFSGVLCGRSTWQGGIEPFLKGGEKGLKNWLEEEGVQIIQELNVILNKYAQPIWPYFD